MIIQHNKKLYNNNTTQQEEFDDTGCEAARKMKWSCSPHTAEQQNLVRDPQQKA